MPSNVTFYDPLKVCRCCENTGPTAAMVQVRIDQVRAAGSNKPGGWWHLSCVTEHKIDVTARTTDIRRKGVPKYDRKF